MPALPRHLLLLLACVALAVPAYGLAAYAWSGYGGAALDLLRLEIPLIFLLALVIYAPQDGRVQLRDRLHALAPILAFYIVYDVYHHLFARSLRVSDLLEFNHLRDLEPRVFAAVIGLVAVLLGYIAWRHLRWLRPLPRTRVLGILAGKAGILVGLALLLQSNWLNAALLRSESFYGFNDWKNIKHNGRLTGVLFYQARQNEALARLAGNDHPRIFDSLYTGTVTQPRNVHVIVLESLLDPRQLSGVSWAPSPLCPRLVPFLGPQGFSMVRSPVYGGFTAQAEFEVLAGLPALRLVNGIEFNSMEGYPASTWVRKLQMGGFRTVASYATHSGFYNTRRAYPSLGFDELHGLDHAPYFQLPAGEKILADSLLYQANLKFLDRAPAASGPIVNYLLTMQGHYPYTRDPLREPTIVQAVPASGASETLVDIANLFYHRTCALADFITALQRSDPQSIVLALSDHLPPDIIGNGIGYPAGEFMNVALMLDRFKPVDLSGRRHHEIAHLLWARLVGQDPPASSGLSAARLESLYLSLHAEAITPVAARAPRTLSLPGND